MPNPNNRLPFFYSCASCGAARSVFRRGDHFRCGACQAENTLNDRGAFVFDAMVIGFPALILQWGIAEVFVDHGWDRTYARLVGLMLGGGFGALVWGAIRPLIVPVVLSQRTANAELDGEK